MIHIPLTLSTDSANADTDTGVKSTYPYTFDACFDVLIGHESGYVNNPKDPGGETNWGISKRSYPTVDIARLTIEGAKEIYRRDFWDRLLCDQLPSPMRFQVFDAAVNSGPGNAARWLQAALGVAQDGEIGPITRHALNMNAANGVMLRMRFNGFRLQFMASLAAWPTFGRGWARRIAGNLLLK